MSLSITTIIDCNAIIPPYLASRFSVLWPSLLSTMGCSNLSFPMPYSAINVNPFFKSDAFCRLFSHEVLEWWVWRLGFGFPAQEVKRKLLRPSWLARPAEPMSSRFRQRPCLRYREMEKKRHHRSAMGHPMHMHSHVCSCSSHVKI